MCFCINSWWFFPLYINIWEKKLSIRLAGTVTDNTSRFDETLCSGVEPHALFTSYWDVSPIKDAVLLTSWEVSPIEDIVLLTSCWQVSSIKDVALFTACWEVSLIRTR